MLFGLGAWPRGSGRGRPQGSGHVADERYVWAGGGEGDTDAVSGLADAGTDLQRPDAQGGELDLGLELGLGDVVAHGQHQPVGGGMQDQAHLIGQGRAAGGPVALEMRLCSLIRFSDWPRAQ